MTDTQAGTENVASGNTKLPWYKRTGWIIALLIIFFPVGLILMWVHSNWSKRTKWIVTGVIAFLVIISQVGGGAEQTGENASSDAETTTTTESTTTSLERTTTTAPVNPATLRAEAVSSWWNGGADEKYLAIADRSQEISDAATNYDVAALGEACEGLRDDVESAQAYDPAPDDEIRAPLTDALAKYARASSNCIAFVSSGEVSLLNDAATQIVDATASIGKATSVIQDLTASLP